MLKYTLILALASCALLVSVNAWMDMTERLKDRVIHAESLLKRGRWLWKNDATDADGSYYLYVNELPERDTYYQPRVQFQTTLCGGGAYLCLESLAIRDYFLTAGYPAGGSKQTTKLERSVYTEDDTRFHWKIMCESDTLEKCKFVPIRFESDNLVMITDNWGGSGHNGGSYDATCGKEDGAKAYFRVHAPNPTDGQVQIFENTNKGNTPQKATYSTTVGVSQTHETSNSLTSTTSVEIGGAFKAVSASGSQSIEKSWTTTDSSTFESAKTIEHTLTIAPRTRVVLKQLKGNYADAFAVATDVYTIEEHPLDSGATRSHTQKISPAKKEVKESEKAMTLRELIKLLEN